MIKTVMPVPNDKQYSEKEVARILRRAAELQERAGYQGRLPQGSSLEEIERIGTEVGIDPVHILSAVNDMDDDGVEESQLKQIKWLGAPEEYFVERTVPGRLDDHVWGSLVGVLNAEYKQSLEGVTAGAFRTWRWKHDLGFVHLAAIQTQRGVRLKLTCHIDDGIVAALIPSVVCGFAGLSLIFAANNSRPWFALVLAPLFAISLAVAFRRSVAGWWANDKKKTRRLMDTLVETAMGANAANSRTLAEHLTKQELQLGHSDP